MKNTRWILERINSFQNSDCLIYDDKQFTYKDLYLGILDWNKRLKEEGVSQGKIISFIADNEPDVLALIYALILNKNILVPLSGDNKDIHDELNKIAEVNGVWVNINNNWV